MRFVLYRSFQYFFFWIYFIVLGWWVGLVACFIIIDLMVMIDITTRFDTVWWQFFFFSGCIIQGRRSWYTLLVFLMLYIVSSWSFLHGLSIVLVHTTLLLLLLLLLPPPLLYSYYSHWRETNYTSYLLLFVLSLCPMILWFDIPFPISWCWYPVRLSASLSEVITWGEWVSGCYLMS